MEIDTNNNNIGKIHLKKLSFLVDKLETVKEPNIVSNIISKILIYIIALFIPNYIFQVGWLTSINLSPKVIKIPKLYPNKDKYIRALIHAIITTVLQFLMIEISCNKEFGVLFKNNDKKIKKRIKNIKEKIVKIINVNKQIVNIDSSWNDIFKQIKNRNLFDLSVSGVVLPIYNELNFIYKTIRPSIINLVLKTFIILIVINLVFQSDIFFNIEKDDTRLGELINSGTNNQQTVLITGFNNALISTIVSFSIICIIFGTFKSNFLINIISII